MLQKRKYTPTLLALMLFASIGPMSVSIAHPENSSSKKVVKKTHPCAWCNKSFNCMSLLTRHTRTHTGEKPYKCTFSGCRYSAAQKNALTNHTRTHTGERPYKCTLCSYSAARKSTLTEHTRTQHPIITPEQSTSTNPLPSNQLARVTAALGVSTEMPASRTKRTSALRKRPATRENQPADSKKVRISLRSSGRTVNLTPAFELPSRSLMLTFVPSRSNSAKVAEPPSPLFPFLPPQPNQTEAPEPKRCMSLLGQSILGDHTETDDFLADPNLLERSFGQFNWNLQSDNQNAIEFLQEDTVEYQEQCLPISPTGPDGYHQVANPSTVKNSLMPEFESITSPLITWLPSNYWNKNKNTNK